MAEKHGLLRVAKDALRLIRRHDRLLRDALADQANADHLWTRLEDFLEERNGCSMLFFYGDSGMLASASGNTIKIQVPPNLQPGVIDLSVFLRNLNDGRYLMQDGHAFDLGLLMSLLGHECYHHVRNFEEYSYNEEWEAQLVGYFIEQMLFDTGYLKIIPTKPLMEEVYDNNPDCDFYDPGYPAWFADSPLKHPAELGVKCPVKRSGRGR